MSLISSIVGSSQTSNAVGELVNSANTAINEGNNATTSAQTGVLNAGTSANNILSNTLSNQTNALSPYTNLGSTSANNLSAALSPGGSLTSQFSFNPNTIASNPDYQFQLQQGLQAVKQAGAATGTLGSSQTIKGEANYAGGLASSEIGQAYNQALSTYQTNYGNTLQSLLAGTGTGLSATNTLTGAQQNAGNLSGSNLINTNTTAGNYGMTNANNIEQLLLDQGQARASGSIQQGNIWGGLLGGAAGAGYGALGAPLANATGGNGAVAGLYNTIGAIAGLG